MNTAPKALLDGQEVLTVQEGCSVTRLSRATLYREIAAGKLRAVKFGSRTMFRADELRRYIAAAQPLGGDHAAA